MVDSVDKITAAAQKILGPDGKIPTEKNLTKEFANEAKCRGAVNTALAKMLGSLIAYRKAASSMKDSCDAYKDDIEASNFGLNPKDPKQNKQIADIQKSISSVLDDYIDRSDKRIKLGDIVHKSADNLPKQINNLP